MKEQLKKMLNGINKQDLIKCIEQSEYINSDNRNNKQVFNRNNSKVIGLRKFHNKIKEGVFKKIVQIYPNKKELTLLEISVGRGGDIRKWDLAGITNVYGFDIDPESITEARNRLNDYQVSKNLNKNNVVLEVGNALSQENLSPRLDTYLTTLGKESFDFVSCQFALHYFFKNEKYLKDVLQLVSNYLSPGGYFFGTVVNGNKLVSYYKSLSEGVSVIDNDYYNIKFDFSRKFRKKYGNEYTFDIKDTDQSNYFSKHGTSTEYLVLMDELNNVAQLVGLQPVNINFFNNANSGNFTDFKDIYRSGKFPELCQREQEISFLNAVFVFKKT